MNWLPEASSFAGRVDELLWFVTIICLVFFVLISGLLIYFSLRYRRRGEGEKTPYVVSNHTLEVIWTLVPTVLVLVIFGYGLVVFNDLRTPPKGAMEINVRGKQWLWQFDYPNGKRTINEMYVPAGVPVKLVMTSDDVLHSFFVPAFRTKQDLVPGMYTTLWFEATEKGEYVIYCAEYCGAGHSAMLGKVVVLTADEYDRWLEGAVAVAAAAEGKSAAELGRELYEKRGCNACHTLDGAPSVGPTFKGMWGHEVELADGTRVVVDENYVRESIYEPQAKVVKGYAPVMPSFKGMLTEEDVGNIIAFLKTLK